MPEIRVFYSWQSDLPAKTNKNAIRKALSQAAKELDQDVLIDEATRDMSGSENIPDKIREKIREADFFVADITPINAGCETRPTPNPNVTFELGYATAHLGWKRTILMNNDQFGGVGLAPFDFDRHRISRYSLSENELGKASTTKLNRLVKVALKKAILDDPLRPHDFSKHHAFRQRDGEMLRDFMELVHWPTVQAVWENGPHRRDWLGIVMTDQIAGLYLSPVFHLYDRKLKDILDEFVTAYGDAMKHTECYHVASNPHVYIFSNPGDGVLSPEQEKKWQAVFDGCERLAGAQSNLLEYVREAYPEIDIVATNRAAWDKLREGIDD